MASCEAIRKNLHEEKTLVGIISKDFLQTREYLEKLARLCPSATFLIINHEDPPLVREWIYQLPKLKWMQATYAGVDNIIHCIEPCNVPRYSLTKLSGTLGASIAEYVMGHVIARERKFLLCSEYQKSKSWCPWEEMKYRVLSDLTIGILGFGSIGKVIAEYCHNMKMKVFVIHRVVPTSTFSYVDKSFGIEDLAECLKECDYLVSILPSAESTKGLLTGEVLENCRAKKTVFINVGRGDLLDEKSILRALDDQWIGGAILDVFESEPLPKESALWCHPQVFITPHVSGRVNSNMVLKVFVDNFQLYKDGKELKYLVDWEKGY
ncbi:glyoxylate/hydroxypyruvate reductase A-like isoform X2 [Xenia sp. Carnegie-2017]|uniref:glyoxylate/hydroxypyruvate reductase A-like n=1 Tax=Xenia sp. Carnegie-2017 TaxID=2897299 RepID=UPI001F03B420|nr:glyoxylate/hydroxypyruvate reductase A-like [Xenia sp. Carnegie-2017]XP_046849409.1 glyoxylate/hydroxypyruvate reductase A-like isoform X2 [Xenia sp. Carnegie-2017]